MQVYLVGGAVRDGLLGLAVHDKDFVVVGASPHDLLSQGFTQVGADFPVFLHPTSHAEYALARTERKRGTGHRGFLLDTQGVSLNDDLVRRDLTINALAIQVRGLFDDTPLTGDIYDPYGGQNDLKNKVLRHISPAFGEDPLRVLRVARFYARLYADGFTIAPDTITLMQTMAQAGELSHLSRERLWSESVKAMEHGTGYLYWQALKELDILPHLLPKLDRCWQSEHRYHAVMERLTLAKNANIAVQVALLCSGYLGYAPELGMGLIDELAQKFNAPNYPIYLNHLLCDFYQLFDKKPCADELIRLIQKSKSYQGNLHTLHDVLTTVFIVSKKPIINQHQATELLHHAIKIYNSISVKDVDTGLIGKDIGLAINALRQQRITQLLGEYFA